MGEREHRAAVRGALKTGEALKALFGRMGTSEHPRGRLISAYRQARRAMAKAKTPAEAYLVLQELRLVVAQLARELLGEAAAAGMRQATTELGWLGLPLSVGPAYAPSAEYAAWLAVYESQATAIQSIYATGGDRAQVLGGADRVGMMTPAPVIREGARWLAVAALAAWAAGTGAGLAAGGRDRAEYRRQVVAAIDERTTDCCLRAHGQVQPMERPFALTGTPRYADEMMHTPFHQYCRSSICLVHAEDADDGLSREMRDAAAAELEARDRTGERVRIHPAHATSRRRR